MVSREMYLHIKKNYILNTELLNGLNLRLYPLIEEIFF